MLLLIPLILVGLILLFGRLLLRYTCARRELPADWEETALKQYNAPALTEAYRAGQAWLARRETEDVEVQSDDGFLLSGVLVPHIAPRATAILFHGWRSTWELDFLPVAPFLYAQGLQLLFVDERAQGDSEGRYITHGVRERNDVSAWVDFISGRFGATHPIFLYGQSMGASAVLMAASFALGGNVRGVIADSCFTSPHEIISCVWRSKTPFPAGFAVWLLDKYARLFADFGLKECSTPDALRKARYPALLIHGTADRLIPSYMSGRAYEACRSEKTLVLIEGAAHGMSLLTDRPRVEGAISAFVDKNL